MTTFATCLFVVGALLLAGPTVLRLLLTGCSAVVPVSTGTTIYLAIWLALLMTTNMIQRSAYIGRINAKYRAEQQSMRQLRKVRALISKVMAVENTVIIASLVLLVFHNLLVKWSTGWSETMARNPHGFAVARYIGIVLIVATIGFFIGKRHQMKNQLQEYHQGFIEEVIEDEVEYHEPENYSRDVERVIQEEEMNIHLPASAKGRLR